MKQNIDEIAKLLTDMMNGATTPGSRPITVDDFKAVVADVEDLKKRVTALEEHRVEDRKDIDELKKREVERDQREVEWDNAIAALQQEVEELKLQLAAASAST